MFGGFKRRRELVEEEINLNPLMNMFVVMIPLLLTGTAFFKLSVINASVPTIADEPLQPGQSEKVVTVVVRLAEDGFHISGTGENVSNKELNAIRSSIPRFRKQLKLDVLTASLSRIKWKYPRGKTLILIAEKSILYEEIVATMDAARWGNSLLATPNTQTKKPILYPDVVLSSLEEGGA